jgi:transcriptional regulator with XRE-family HTH domain
MSMIAVKAFVRELRRLRKMTQPDVADAAGLSTQQYYRWETGEQVQTNDEAVLRVLVRVHAPWDEIVALLLDQQATAQDGRDRALAYMTSQLRPEEQRIALERYVREQKQEEA